MAVLPCPTLIVRALIPFVRLTSLTLRITSTLWIFTMTDRLPFVLATPADDYACGRYRVRDPFTALFNAGLVDGVVFPYFLDDPLFRDLAPDVLVVQRVLEHDQIAVLERYRRLGFARIVFDLDDLLTITPRDNKCTRRFHDDVAARLNRAMLLCDRLVFSTDFLKSMDASGNACPSLHVATAVFSGIWLHHLHL